MCKDTLNDKECVATDIPTKAQVKDYKYNRLYMDFATRVAQMSYAERKKVGAVLIKDGNMVSHGFNGMPASMPNRCEDDDGNTLPEVLHAEVNLIAKLSRSTMSSESGKLFLTLSPCKTCATMLWQAGISEVMYLEEYRDKSGIELLNKLGVKTSQFVINEDMEKLCKK